MLSIFFAQIRRLSHISPGLKLISHKYLTDILVKNCKWLSRWELFPGRCWRHHFSRGINRTGQGGPVCSLGSTVSSVEFNRRPQAQAVKPPRGGARACHGAAARGFCVHTSLHGTVEKESLRAGVRERERESVCVCVCVCFQLRQWKCYTEHPTVKRLTDEDGVACLSVEHAPRSGSSFFL